MPDNGGKGKTCPWRVQLSTLGGELKKYTGQLLFRYKILKVTQKIIGSLIGVVKT